MLDLTPRCGDLDPIEIASRDEIAALQLERLKHTLRHVYDNVAHYRKAFDAAGVHPDALHSLADIGKLPFTTKADLRDTYPFGLFAAARERDVRLHASSGTTGKPIVVAYTQRRHRHLDQVMVRDPRRRRARARRYRPERLRLRPVHRRPRPALRRRGAGRHGDPHLRRQHGAPDHGDEGLRPDGHCTPSYFLHLLIAGRGEMGSTADCCWKWAFSAPSPGRRPCAARSKQAAASTPTTSTACRRSSAPAWP